MPPNSAITTIFDADTAVVEIVDVNISLNMMTFGMTIQCIATLSGDTKTDTFSVTIEHECDSALTVPSFSPLNIYMVDHGSATTTTPPSMFPTAVSALTLATWSNPLCTNGGINYSLVPMTPSSSTYPVVQIVGTDVTG
jgi:hypothetical protein